MCGSPAQAQTGGWVNVDESLRTQQGVRRAWGVLEGARADLTVTPASQGLREYLGQTWQKEGAGVLLFNPCVFRL